MDQMTDVSSLSYSSILIHNSIIKKHAADQTVNFIEVLEKGNTVGFNEMIRKWENDGRKNILLGPGRLPGSMNFVHYHSIMNLGKFSYLLPKWKSTRLYFWKKKLKWFQKIWFYAT